MRDVPLDTVRHPIDVLMGMSARARRRWLKRLANGQSIAIGAGVELQQVNEGHGGYKVRTLGGQHVGSFADLGEALHAASQVPA